MTRTLRFLTAATAATASFAITSSAASASTVEVRDGEHASKAYYVAAPGERNDVLVSHVDDYTLRLSDGGAMIVPASGCRSIDASTVECTTEQRPGGRPYLVAAEVVAADMDDIVRSSGEPTAGIAGPRALRGPAIIADGGPGNDTLVGAAGFDRLGGGGGRDRLIGKDGDDFFTDGDTSDDANADHLDGGEGFDEVSYATRTRRVTVDLSDRGRDGAPGEGDVLRSFERAEGGDGNDLLVGSSTYNALRGGAGRDRLEGHGHGDELFGGEDDDRLYGQRGNDTLDGGAGENVLNGGPRADVVRSPGGVDHVDCGAGPDVVLDAEVFDFLAPDCEVVRYLYDADGAVPAPDGEGDISIRMSANPVTVRRDTLTFSVECPYRSDSGGECAQARGTFHLRHARTSRPLGFGRLTAAAGERSAATERPARVRVRLTRRGRAVAARREGVVVSMYVEGHLLPSARWTFHVRTR